MTGRQLGECSNKDAQPMDQRPRLGLRRGRGAGLGRRQAWFKRRGLNHSKRFTD